MADKNKATGYPSRFSISCFKAIHAFTSTDVGLALSSLYVQTTMKALYAMVSREELDNLSEAIDIPISKSTKITGPVGNFPSGTKDLNQPNNIRIVKKLLNTSLGCELTLDGFCDNETIKAIESFQSCFEGLSGDGMIGSNGETFHCLKYFYLTPPMKLTWSGLMNIFRGAFQFIAENSSSQINFKGRIFKMDLSSGRYSISALLPDKIMIPLIMVDEKRFTFSEKQLIEFMDYVDRKRFWSQAKRNNKKITLTRIKKIKVSLVLKYQDRIIKSSSNSTALTLPFEPIPKTDLNPTLNGRTKDMPYVSKPAPETELKFEAEGRYLIAVGDRYFFCYYYTPPYNQKTVYAFEMDPEKLGFDCNSYAGSILGLKITDLRRIEVPPGDPTKLYTPMSASDVTSQVAEADKVEFPLDSGEKVLLENVAPGIVDKFFSSYRKGVFLFWNYRHIRIYVHGKIHEFRNPTKDYVCSDPNKYNYDKYNYWVRRVPENHPVASKWK